MEVSIVKIKKITEDLINFIRQDLIDNAVTPEYSWLYLTFGDVYADDQSFYEQLKYIIELGDDDRNNLLVRLMFDKERANMPTIHIHYPAEDGRTGDNSLNTGFLNTELVQDELVNKYSRAYIGSYDMVITGGNSLEVVMLYEFMDALLIAGADTLAYHFDKFEFSGKQLLPNQDIIPHLTFYRAIGITLQRKKVVHSLAKLKKFNDIEFNGHFNT